MSDNDKQILSFLAERPHCSSTDILDGLSEPISLATIKRVLSFLQLQGLVTKSGNGKATKYRLSDQYTIVSPVDLDQYFQKEVDQRAGRRDYNHELISNVLRDIQPFSRDEMMSLVAMQDKFSEKTRKLTPSQYQQEQERLAIDLSWKSSQIEGNTYSLLETERLLKEKETASGKHKDEATMLLNHKAALDFISENPDYLDPVQVSRIEEIHKILMTGLDVDYNIRNRSVGITGTNYRPLDNEYQIKEALYDTCRLVNARDNVFEKALFLLLLLSYIQPFEDGNKRTARIVSNACLAHHKHCPISFRTVNSLDYKMAMLVFYEQNNIYPMKKIFMEQFAFAVDTYF